MSAPERLDYDYDIEDWLYNVQGLLRAIHVVVQKAQKQKGNSVSHEIGAAFVAKIYELQARIRDLEADK